MMIDQACGKCEYWIRVEDRDYGQCRRYPPQVLVTFDITQEPVLDPTTGIVFNVPRVVNNVKFMFPQMSDDNTGCGEFIKENDNEGSSE